MPVFRHTNRFRVGILPPRTVIMGSVRGALNTDEIENLIAHLYVMSEADRENVDRLIAEIQEDSKR